MANRLAPYLNQLVSSNQTNHQVVAQEKDLKSVMYWAFLLEVLNHLCFGHGWCNLISNLLATSSTQVLLNGDPGEFTRHQRGLRQGDPLSPMLFILVMDVLSSLFAKAENVGLHPLDSHNTRPRVSLYADVALFIRPFEEDFKCTIDILECFGAASGLETNLQKSCVIPTSCEENALRRVDDTLHYPTAEFPCTYLGLRCLTRSFANETYFLGLRRLQTTSLDGRPLFSIWPEEVSWLVYLLIAMNVPKWAVKAIDKIIRAFLWKGRIEGKISWGCCLVAWEKVTRPIDLGGLGILNLQIMVSALQMRWLWLSKTDISRSWAGLDTIIQPQAKALFAISVVSQVGSGSHKLFWADKWVHGTSI
ncbi:hypothetical protein U9M48_042441 [Paspalum notatum var. saurae]|uniref:Reverse transcriptase domain-containing protein n=1 Tax=Paspalum notatum var. saurae TaxID=547442 RepID=A0AAQ3UQJ4_PASNO